MALSADSSGFRDGEEEGRSLSGFGLDPDPAAILLHDSFTDGKANPGASVFVPLV